MPQTAPLIRRFPRNTVGRDFICGDIHGHVDKLLDAVHAAGFNPDADRLFLLGDLVDRGPESDLVLNLLHAPWCFALRGNHDQWAIDYHEGRADVKLYAMNGGAWFIGKTPAERQPFVDAFAELPLAIELETEHGTIGMVHANVPAGGWRKLTDRLDWHMSLPHLQMNAIKDTLMWDRSRVENMTRDEVEGVLAVCVGHTPVTQVTSLGNVIYLDTGAWLPRNADRPFVLVDAADIRAGGVLARSYGGELQW